ncbi:MAG: thiamine pyrophosphate-binding protein [Alphaproteobacteria bacterium]|nr:thiamine pyrophosphate-binding protein [Alphaproteobacteria bacterium]
MTDTEDAGRPGRRIHTYQILAEDLQAHGVEAVFGLMSDDTADFAATLDMIGIAFHGARHENSAVVMAEGYAAATGRLGIAVIGRGPATANGLHASVYASRTGSKVLIIYGEANVLGGAINGIGPDYKEFNAEGVLSAAGLRTFVATSPRAARTALADAIAAAELGGTATLRLPVDVQHAEIEIAEDDERPALPPPSKAPVGARPPAIGAATALLEKSRRPLIIGGLGAHRAGAKEALENLAEKIGALLITTARGKDMFRGNPHNLGIIGSFSHSAARRMIDQADCVIVFGAGLNFLTTSFGTFVPEVPLIQVDRMRSHIGRWLDADVAVVGDARLVAEQLLDALPDRSAEDKPCHSEETLKFLAEFDLADDFEDAGTARTLDPRSLGIELDKMLPQDRNMVYDGGNFLGIVPYLSTPGPAHFKLTSDFASIGLSFGAAMGVAKARPDNTTVLVVGDGGFVMTLGELETVVREDLPIVIILMNDCAYGAEVHFLRMHQLPISKSLFPDVDFAPVAEAFGFQAATVRTLEEVRALAPMLEKPDGPILIDCKINADIAAPFMNEFAQFESRND